MIDSAHQGRGGYGTASFFNLGPTRGGLDSSKMNAYGTSSAYNTNLSAAGNTMALSCGYNTFFDIDDFSPSGAITPVNFPNEHLPRSPDEPDGDDDVVLDETGKEGTEHENIKDKTRKDKPAAEQQSRTTSSILGRGGYTSTFFVPSTHEDEQRGTSNASGGVDSSCAHLSAVPSSATTPADLMFPSGGRFAGQSVSLVWDMDPAYCINRYRTARFRQRYPAHTKLIQTLLQTTRPELLETVSTRRGGLEGAGGSTSRGSGK
ncbi:unnamed protein product [Amoebophrya sp. A25]|nr:unnamed protein product [Amoebophrya sp. A25]|eukprot:GSA25T00014927001.1